MSNRRKVRSNGRGTGRVTPRTPRPLGGGQEGVEIDVADGNVFLTLHMGRANLVIGWSGRDTETIAGLLGDAARQALEGDVGEAKEIVRGSGLVVPGIKDVADVARAVSS